ncbi:outer membrane protein [Novosphingobium album (ex Liu et al. 2023)]|uniref:Porin family protein n=1 Tax=Novosphingobium album (ex Liu et al. 2023) TaxID=3031130 RepID=A0ABT5WKR9_9SPHN|nr:porin family protein [Novosphingobium album (ex Liu et al. 2023)]MDE8650626.1 porin family protein [Novosphingobium album (ex Liu et al. 2023)]
MKSSLRTLAGAMVAAGLVAAVPAHAEPFNGPFVGVQAGWNQNDIGALDGDLGVVGVDRKKDSVVGGIFAGYDHKIGASFVIGAEAGFNMGIDDKMTRRGAVDTIVNPLHAFDVSARAGYLVNDKSLIYVRGGYDNMRARTTVIGPNATLSSKDSYDGWMVGGGFERALGEKVSTRLEYRYSDLGSDAGKFDRHQVLLGVAYRF